MKKNVRFMGAGEIGDIDQRSDVKRKLQKHGQEDIEIEDISQGTFSRKFFDRLLSEGVSGTTQHHQKCNQLTFALEMHKKQTDINMPVIVI